MAAADNIVLLSGSSEESRQKALSWARAANTLGLRVRRTPDRGTGAVLACSDHRFVDAAWLAHAHGAPGPDPAAAVIASNKALAYQYLRSRGFEMLNFLVPESEAELAVPWSGPVMVKPERGSGSYALHPWGYRVFDSLRDFRRFLERSRNTHAFFEHQSRPHPDSGRYFAMEYVDTQRLYTTHFAYSDREMVAYDHWVTYTHPVTKLVESQFCGQRHPQSATVAAMAKQFLRLGLRRTLLTIQCVERRGELFPIDFNFRVAPTVDRLWNVMRSSFYVDALEFLIGRSAKLDFAWPSPRMGIHRMLGFRAPRGARVEFGPGCIPLVDSVSYDARKPYDIGYVFPMFAFPCRDHADFQTRLKAALASVRVVRPRRSSRAGRA
jgi:hypothetical protein